jgi:hypothetical protein
MTFSMSPCQGYKTRASEPVKARELGILKAPELSESKIMS